MKKLVLCVVLLSIILTAVGCRKEDIVLTAEEVTTNTILAKSNGVLQVATVEDFNKSYYSLSELEDFIKKEVDAYNKKIGDNKVAIEEIKLNSGKAVMLLTYSGMEQYVNFNEVPAAYFSGGVTEVPIDLPATLVSTKNETLASTQEILQNNKLKILVMNEPYEIIVDGDIKYYSENAAYLDDNKVQGAKEGMTIVVFKP
jgi:hypothetical protein